LVSYDTVISCGINVCCIDTTICMPRTGCVHERSGPKMTFCVLVTRNKTPMMEPELLLLFSLHQYRVGPPVAAMHASNDRICAVYCIPSTVHSFEASSPMLLPGISSNRSMYSAQVDACEPLCPADPISATVPNGSHVRHDRIK